MLELIYMQDTHPRLQKRGWWLGSIWPPPWPSPEPPAPPHLGHHHLLHSLNLFRCNQRIFYFAHKCKSLHLNNQSWIPLERYKLKFIAQKRFKSRWASYRLSTYHIAIVLNEEYICCGTIKGLINWTMTSKKTSVIMWYQDKHVFCFH